MNTGIITDNDREVLNNNEDCIKKYLVQRIQYAIENNLDSIELFTLGKNANDTAQISKKDYLKNLMSITNYFVKSEQYEWASFIKKIISYYDKKQVENYLKEITEERK